MDQELANESFCYLITTGRVTGEPHEIEIWFALRDDTIYMLSGGGDRSDWVRNILANPEVRVRIRDQHFEGRARVVEEPGEEEWARAGLPTKYGSSYGGDLTRWSRTALPIAVDLRSAT